MTNIFIDTNIWLSAFDGKKENNIHLFEMLKNVLGKDVKLIITEQVYNEYLKNYTLVINKVLQDKRIPEFNFQNVFRAYPQFETLEKYINLSKGLLSTLKNQIISDIFSQSSKLDETINFFMTKEKIIKPTKEIINNALLRVKMGNPPGKSNSYGDAINWEHLLEIIPEREDLHFITNDEDFYLDKEKHFANYFLTNEWKNRKNSNILFYSSLKEFIDNAHNDQNIKEEQIKNKLIQKFRISKTINEAISIIQELKKHSELSYKQKLNLLNIFFLDESPFMKLPQTKNNLNWIIDNPEIYTFYKSLILDTPKDENGLVQSSIEIFKMMGGDI